MGKLLDLGIQASQKTGPTLTVNYSQLTGGFCNAYKNGSLYGAIINGSNVIPIVSGDTFYVTATPDSGGYVNYAFYINNVLQTSGSIFGTYTSATYTASGSNIYRFEIITDVP